MTEPAAVTVCAVIVSYRPEPAALRRLVDGMMPQVGAVVLVDNAGDDGWQLDLGRRLAVGDGELLGLSHNVGLAAAQNIGIEWARSHGYRHVLLLDQDSEPGGGMVAALMSALLALSSAGRVAAVGPRFQDLRENRDAPFVRIGFPLSRKLWCESAMQSIPCDFLISSGSLIPMEVLDRVGPMDEGLFIDNVDMEWSFRARARGYALYGVCAALMQHRLGDARRQLPFGVGQIVVHGPVRLYYMMRNRLRLYRMPHVPRIWIAQDLPRVLVKLFLFGTLIGPRWRNLRCMLRGLWDGLCGMEGACPAELLRAVRRD
ncbi:glycosyltransferase family 2 protein [Rhodanobacter sp. DHB23]|uniref:glycosyltransferase family 2 protein n=1 Tax=Rhodanobacter sp. DHB23 TaxID=2775923 RepID=UPI001785D0A7|nr:glycosyltransferase family 2 protein [Rhodanobacter sp. DHB23]MBD8873270.1 glycosyltransferase family 2 protein [Rhodanobacter sp. DHB23]